MSDSLKNPLLIQVEGIRKKAKTRDEKLASTKKTDDKKLPMFLPKYPIAVRAAPNGILRSALFGVIKRGARRYLKHEKIAAIDTVEVTYTGERLDQADLDLWLNVLQLVSARSDNKPECEFTAYFMLNQLGLTNSGKNMETLNTRLTRLKANAVELTQGKYNYMGSLIDVVLQDTETKKYKLKLNPDLSKLFARDHFSQIEWAVRAKLSSKPLAQWLHGFYTSHAQAYPLKVETLHDLCGSESKNMRSFKADLIKNLNQIANVCHEHGETFSFEIQDNLVSVKKQPTKSQAKHLLKKKRNYGGKR